MRRARGPSELGFTSHDRRRLRRALKQCPDARSFRRIQATLLVAEGWPVREAARITASSPRAVYQWVARDPLRLGYSATQWTVALLASHLSQRYNCSIVTHTLRRRLRAMGLRWKRPRHAFTEKDPHRAQKKGRLSAD